MQSAWRVRGLGLAFLAATPALLLLLKPPVGAVAAVGLGAIGLYLAVVVAERTVPAAALDAVAAGEAQSMRGLRRALRLEGGPATVLDERGRAHLFFPARAEDGTHGTMDQPGVHTGHDGHRSGLSLASGAEGLLAQWRRSGGTDALGQGLAEGQQTLAGLGRETDLLHRLDVVADADALRVRFRAGAVQPPCQQAARTCDEGGCLACHCVLLTLSEAAGTPLELEEGTSQGGWVSLRLRKRGT